MIFYLFFVLLMKLMGFGVEVSNCVMWNGYVVEVMEGKGRDVWIRREALMFIG